ncbi:hypothetical protein P1P91_05965 [Halomonas piscis]|uniref:DUF4351 domain-containing protein n=1 Tax=Halomonas piscis TaxID=3031727 RepID=A0ABY9Z2Y8_9GAMM|nr:hypothetical protein [Halomonas piscis]WNK21218.1 hypothetical protein P1P91_05965 [Halomonas piscis]
MAYVNTLERQALAKERMSALESTLRKQMTLKFGDIPAWATQRLADASQQELEVWAEKNMTADSLEAVFAH